MKIRWVGVVAAMWLAGVASSYAATLVHAKASSWDFSWSIYDANPDDGLAPSVSFLDAANAWRSLVQLELSYNVENGATIAVDSSTAYAAAGAEPAVLARSISPSAGYSGAGIRSRDGGLVANIALNGPGLSGSAYAGISSTATDIPSDTFYNLVLGPGTGLRMSTWSKVERWVTREYFSDRFDFAVAQVQLFTRFSRPDANGFYNAATRVASPVETLRIVGDGGDFSAAYYATDTQQLSLQFENLTDGPLVGRIRVDARADASTGGVAVIPEPGSAALMLLGVAGLVCAVRRRTARPLGERGVGNERIAIRS